MDLYRSHVPKAQWDAWRERLKKPTRELVRGSTNNWETYVMKGDWMRAKAGFEGSRRGRSGD